MSHGHSHGSDQPKADFFTLYAIAAECIVTLITITGLVGNMVDVATNNEEDYDSAVSWLSLVIGGALRSVPLIAMVKCFGGIKAAIERMIILLMRVKPIVKWMTIVSDRQKICHCGE